MRKSPRKKPIGTTEEDAASSVQRLWIATIAGLHSELGYSPSSRELARSLGCTSTNAVKEMLVRLQRKGFVDYEKNRARTLRVTPLGFEQLGV